MIFKLTGGRHVQRLKYTRKLLIWKGYQAFSLPIGTRLSEKYSEGTKSWKSGVHPKY